MSENKNQLLARGVGAWRYLPKISPTTKTHIIVLMPIIYLMFYKMELSHLKDRFRSVLIVNYIKQIASRVVIVAVQMGYIIRLVMGKFFKSRLKKTV